jgi:hypothetical protein
MAAPTLMYGSGNWDPSRYERRETETAEMPFVKRVPVYRTHTQYDKTQFITNKFFRTKNPIL